jgi:mRNA interferase RelE/StbE
MASYNVVFKSSAEKDLRSLPQAVVARIFKRLEPLAKDPFPRQAIKLTSTEQLYRIRVGDYRIVYGVDQHAKQVMVHYIRHRRDVYRHV